MAKARMSLRIGEIRITQDGVRTVCAASVVELRSPTREEVRETLVGHGLDPADADLRAARFARGDLDRVGYAGRGLVVSADRSDGRKLLRVTRTSAPTAKIPRDE